jgi:outer membrane protein assembly factor BamB
MTAPQQPGRPPFAAWQAFRFPLTVLGGMAAVIASLWLLPRSIDRVYPTMGTLAVLPLGLVVLLAWVPGARLPRPWGWLAAGLLLSPVVVLCVVFKVEAVRVSGDMWPQLRFRFAADPDDILADHLGDAANAEVPADVDLSGSKPTDFPAYRGRNRDGVVLGPELSREWSTPPKQLWLHPIGGGHSQFVVVDKVLYTMEQRRDHEAVTCYDAGTGKQIWAFTYPALFDDPQGDRGPRATPAVDRGEVFAFGATGMLTCLDARTGKPKWGPLNLLEGNSNMQWGLSTSPLVTEKLVLVNVGKQVESAPNGTVVALDRKTGKVQWSAGSTPAGYSSPALAMIGGKQQILLFDGTGVAGYDLAQNGAQLWRFPWETSFQVNAGQPLAIDSNKVFIASGYSTGGAMLEVKEQDGKWAARKVWKTSRMRCKFTSPVYYNGHIYGLDDGTLACIDAATGKATWPDRGGDYGHGQVLLCKDLLIVQSEQGVLALVEARPDEFHELGSFQALPRHRSWNPPAMADGRVYLRNNVQMACYDLLRR